MALSTYAITRINDTQFTVVSDLTTYFEEYRPILMVGDTQTRLYVHNSSYDSVLTLVTVSGGTIEASASGVAIGDLSISGSAIPFEYLDTLYANIVHTHDDRYYTEAEITTISGDILSGVSNSYVSNETMTTISGDIVSQFPSDYISDSEMTTISGDIVSQIPSLTGYATEAYVTTVSGDIVSQIPTDYISDTEMTVISGDIVSQIPTDYYTQSEVQNLITTASGDILTYVSDNYVDNTDMTTISGDLVSQIIAASGTTNHSLLTSLDYASSGHTGFQPTGDYATNSQLATTSGDIVSQIPSLTGYATESYVDTVSGALHTEIENIDLNFISNAEMTVISGDIIAQIPTDYYTQGQIATISGDIVAQIPTDYISDSEMTTISGDILTTAYNYADAQDTTLSGLLHAEIVAASGTTDHSLLTSLDYASSGHTGFQPAGDYVTETEFTTYSGDIISQIPSLAGYATESYVDTVSGALHTEITNIDLSNYYTKTEVTTISGDLVSGYNTGDSDTLISANGYTDTLIATVSGDIVAQIPSLSGYATESWVSTNYIDNSEFTTYSGDIIAQIPSLSGYATESYVDTVSGALHTEIVNIDLDYISNAEMTVISGDIIAQIPTDYISDAEMTVISGDLVVGYENADGLILINAMDYTDTSISGLEGTLDAHTGDTSIHYLVGSIDHGAIAGLTDDDHTQYHNDTRGDARYYTQAQVTTISGDLVGQMITDHGVLTGLGDDDHTQYILVNGTRDFTSVVGGVTPTDNDHLVTKAYVDALWGPGLSVAAGTHSMVSGTSSTTIDFGINFPGTGYGLAVEMQNLVDPNPAVYDFTITEVTTSGFAVELTGVIDSDNYYLRYTAITSGTISATDHGALSGLLDDDHPQYQNDARGDARYYTQAQVDTISGTLEAGKSDVGHTHVKADITDLGTPISNLVEDTSPQLGGNLDLNGKYVDFGTTLTSSGVYIGDVMTVTVDDASTTFGDVLYQAADFHFDRADADSTSTSPVFVLALESGAGSKKVLVRGEVCSTSWSWSAGKLYLSPTTGTMTNTKVTGSGQVIQVLGFALSANTVWFDPVTMVAEVA